MSTINNSKVEIYYSRGPIISRMMKGGISAAIGLLSFISFNFIELGNDEEMEISVITIVSFSLICSPIIWGTLTFLRAFMRLLTKEPQISIDKEGILLAEFKGFGKIKWENIESITFEEIPSLSSQSKEPSIKLDFTKEYQETVFTPYTSIKVAYMDINSNELYTSLKKVWDNKKGKSQS